jgi:hypothetical protein
MGNAREPERDSRQLAPLAPGGQESGRARGDGVARAAAEALPGDVCVLDGEGNVRARRPVERIAWWVRVTMVLCILAGCASYLVFAWTAGTRVAPVMGGLLWLFLVFVVRIGFIGRIAVRASEALAQGRTREAPGAAATKRRPSAGSAPSCRSPGASRS